MNRALLATIALFGSAEALEVESHYESECVSVMTVRVSPHEEIGLHRDAYPQLVFGIQGGTITCHGTDGTTKSVVFPTGACVKKDPDPEGALHTSVNDSDLPVELLIIQLKKGNL